MSALNNKVTFINPSNEKNVYKAIKAFIESHESINTRNNYERHIRDFFKTMRGKKIEDLIENDLVFTALQIDSYQIELKKKYKGKTVNATMSPLKTLYSKLEKWEFNVKAQWFNVDRADENDTESYDTLSHQEVCEAINLVLKTRKGFEKALLIRLAYATAFRQTALLNLKWSDIIERDGVWCIKTKDKGNKNDIKKISQELYDLLMKHKETTDKPTIFELEKKTVIRMMKFINGKMDFGDRKIVFHSFKKASIDEVNIITQGNLKAMQRHGNHKSVKTTLDIYTKKAELDDLVVVDVNYKVPLEKFDDLTKEQLIDLIKSADRNTQIKLLQKIK